MGYKKLKKGFPLILVLLSYQVSSFAQSNEELILAATEPLPENFKSNATVELRTPSGSIEILRQGDNGLICRPDNSAAPGYAVPCFHESMLPLFNRKQELRTQGLTQTKANELINREIRDGDLKGPEIGSFTAWISGPSRAESELGIGVYLGDVTGSSTGLPTEPGSTAWLMCSGTPQAHMMIGLPGLGDRNRTMEQLCGPAEN